MIVDNSENLKKYKNIPNLEEILDFIKSRNLLDLPDGKVEIDGEKLFANVSRYFPAPAEEKDFETHDDYTDVHLVVKGVEKIQASDSLGNISEVIVGENNFVVFFVGEAHKPGCLYRNFTDAVTKIVFKTKS